MNPEESTQPAVFDPESNIRLSDGDKKGEDVLQDDDTAPVSDTENEVKEDVGLSDQEDNVDNDYDDDYNDNDDHDDDCDNDDHNDDHDNEGMEDEIDAAISSEDIEDKPLISAEVYILLL